MPHRFFAFAALALAVAFAQAAAGQDGGDPDAESRVADIEVVGRTEEAVRSFVEDVAVSEGRRTQLGRFNRYVCPGVINMRADYAQVINDRIARLAHSLDLRVGGPGCRPNILVVAMADAAEIDQLIHRSPRIFGRYAQGRQRGNAAMEQVLRPYPVRWWHHEGFVATGEHFSRLRAAGRTDITKSLVLMDMGQIGSVRFGALADYVAMVALARLNPEAETSQASTVLNLFQTETTRRTSAGLTDWDLDYLTALYNAPRYARDRRLQQGDMVWQMMQSGDVASVEAEE